MKKFLTLTYFPAIPDLGMLALRAWFGLSMLLLHGMVKLNKFSAMVEMMHADGKGFPKFLAVAAILAESVSAALIVLGLFTRWAALTLIVTMGVAFFVAHKAVLDPMAPPPGSGELAYLYLGAFVAIFIGGAGRYSVDAKISK